MLEQLKTVRLGGLGVALSLPFGGHCLAPFKQREGIQISDGLPFNERLLQFRFIAQLILNLSLLQEVCNIQLLHVLTVQKLVELQFLLGSVFWHALLVVAIGEPVLLAL